MIGCFIASTLLVYAVYNIIRVDKFIENAKNNRLLCLEEMLLVFSYLWFVVQLFLSSGPIALITIVMLVWLTFRNKKIYYIIFFIVIFLSTIAIMINQKILKIEMWKELYNLIF